MVPVLCSIFLLLFSVQYSSSISRGMDVGMFKIQGENREITGQDTFPYMVHLKIIETLYKRNGRTKQYISGCGGVIISEIAILTAAHCVEDVPEDIVQEVYVRAGLVHLAYEKGQVRRMTKYVRHQEYVGYCPITREFSAFCFNDILVGFIDKPFTLGPNVKIAKLSNPADKVEGKEGWIIGWGYDENGDKMKMLKMAYMGVLSNTQCQAIYYEILIAPNMICLTSDEYRSGCCEGDSGGPFVVDGVVYGIASFSSFLKLENDRKICNPKEPSVYTNIADYRQWIGTTLSRGPPTHSMFVTAARRPTRQTSCTLRGNYYGFVL